MSTVKVAKGLTENDQEYVEFLDTRRIELSGGEFHFTERNRIWTFGIFLFIGLIQSINFLYLQEVYFEAYEFYTDFAELLPNGMKIIKLFWIVIGLQLPLNFVRIMALFIGLKRDQDRESIHQNPEPPRSLVILLHFSRIMILLSMIALFCYSKNLKEMKEDFKTEFKKFTLSYLTDATHKQVIDKFQTSQRCCGVGPKTDSQNLKDRWKGFNDDDKYKEEVPIKTLKIYYRDHLKTSVENITRMWQVPFTCCDIESGIPCSIGGEQVVTRGQFRYKAMSTQSCEVSMDNMSQKIGGFIELLMLLFFVLEMIGVLFYTLLIDSINDEYINVQRPSVVRISYIWILLCVVGTGLYYKFCIRFFDTSNMYLWNGELNPKEHNNKSSFS